MPVLKVLDLHKDMLTAVRDYKKANPDGLVVLRIYHTNRYMRRQDPVKTAEELWDNVIWKAISQLSKQDRKLIDYVEATNEMGECPTWESAEDTDWFIKFNLKFIELCSKAGFKPCIACIPVGNPPGDNAGLSRILQFAPALRAARKAGGVWSYHGYTIKYSKDPSVEVWYSLRYRQWYQQFKGEYADLADMPMIMTETGVDFQGQHDKDGWQMRGTQLKFHDWLTWFDSELKLDKYILGVSLFQQGAKAAWNGWSSFDHEPLADWLVKYWNEDSRKVTAGSVPSVKAERPAPVSHSEAREQAPPPPPPALPTK